MYRKFELYKLTENYGMHLVYVGAVGLVVCLLAAPVIGFIWGGSVSLLVFGVGLLTIAGVAFLSYRRLYSPPPAPEFLSPMQNIKG